MCVSLLKISRVCLRTPLFDFLISLQNAKSSIIVYSIWIINNSAGFKVYYVNIAFYRLYFFTYQLFLSESPSYNILHSPYPAALEYLDFISAFIFILLILFHKGYLHIEYLFHKKPSKNTIVMITGINTSGIKQVKFIFIFHFVTVPNILLLLYSWYDTPLYFNHNFEYVPSLSIYFMYFLYHYHQPGPFTYPPFQFFSTSPIGSIIFTSDISSIL